MRQSDLERIECTIAEARAMDDALEWRACADQIMDMIRIKKFAMDEIIEESLTLNEYQIEAMSTSNKRGNDITIGILGLCGEAGELADLMKKHLHQGHDLDKSKIIEELGDVMWYLAYTAQQLGVLLDVVANHNLMKLRKRYPEGFDPERSKNREAA